jgi:ATP-dependent RNA helicase DDX18/HAS1
MQVPLNEYEFPTSRIANVQAELQRLIEKNYYLHTSAKEAYRAYVLAYNSHSLKDIFNVHTLDLCAIAQSFGFTRPPKVRFWLQHLQFVVEWYPGVCLLMPSVTMHHVW